MGIWYCGKGFTKFLTLWLLRFIQRTTVVSVPCECDNNGTRHGMGALVGCCKGRQFDDDNDAQWGWTSQNT